MNHDLGPGTDWGGGLSARGPFRRIAAWLMPRSFLVSDLLTMAAERDGWKARYRLAKGIADDAAMCAHRYADELAKTQAQLDSTTADFEAYVLTGERRG